MENRVKAYIMGRCGTWNHEMAVKLHFVNKTNLSDWRKVDHSPPSSAEVRNEWSHYLHSPYTPSRHGQG